MVVRFPARAQDITPALLTELISAQHLTAVVQRHQSTLPAPS
jgi:hypothetical protein